MTTSVGSTGDVRMEFPAFVSTLEEGAEGCATVTVAGFLFRREFGKALTDFREVKQRVVAESVRAPGRAQNKAFRLAVKGRQCMSIARHGDHADKAASAELVGNFVELAQQPRIVGCVIG